MTKKSYESSSVLPVACESGGGAAPGADVASNRDETGARILARLRAKVNCAEEPGTITVTQ